MNEILPVSLEVGLKSDHDKMESVVSTIQGYTVKLFSIIESKPLLTTIVLLVAATFSLKRYIDVELNKHKNKLTHYGIAFNRQANELQSSQRQTRLLSQKLEQAQKLTKQDQRLLRQGLRDTKQELTQTQKLTKEDQRLLRQDLGLVKQATNVATYYDDESEQYCLAKSDEPDRLTELDSEVGDLRMEVGTLRMEVGSLHKKMDNMTSEYHNDIGTVDQNLDAFCANLIKIDARQTEMEARQITSDQHASSTRDSVSNLELDVFDLTAIRPLPPIGETYPSGKRFDRMSDVNNMFS